MRQALRIAGQVGILTLVSLGGNALSEWRGWPIPGNVVGLLAMLLLLQTRVVRIEWVEEGANWLVSRMLLFFVPAAVGIIAYKSLLAERGLALLLLIIGSTAAVMLVTGVSVEYLARRRGRREPGVDR